MNIHAFNLCANNTNKYTMCNVYMQVNAKYFDQYDAWSQDFPGVQLINDGTMCNEERLGAVATIQLAVSAAALRDHVIVIGGSVL